MVWLSLALWLTAAQSSAPDPLGSARAQLRDGQPAAALQTLQPLLNGDDPAAKQLAAQVRIELGEVTRARLSLEATLHGAPMPDTHRDLARCYRALGDEERTLEQATLAASGGADGAIPLLVAALAVTRAASDADEILNGTLASEDRSGARTALAQAYSSAARHRDAADMWTRSLTEEPLSPYAPRWQAYVAEEHRRSGRMAKEVEALEALLVRYDSKTEWDQANPGQRTETDALIASRLQGALNHYALDIQMMPGNTASASALQALSRLYSVWLGRFPGDIKTRQRQLEYGALLTRQQRFPEALAQYEDAYRSDPDAPGAAEALKNIVHLSYRMMHADTEEQGRWLRRLLWAADEHSHRFATLEAGAALQWRAAEGLLQVGRTEDAMERMETVISRWPTTRSAERAARRTLDIHILAEDWDSTRQAALRYAAMPNLGDDAFHRRVQDVISQTSSD